jgi:ABC-type uncharacterized transport system substrate-binding protein
MALVPLLARRLCLLVALAAPLLVPGTPAAHPHVWITNVTTFVFAQERLVALRFVWTFDEMFSAAVSYGYDRNKDGTFDAAETAKVQAEAFSNLREYNYFMNIRIDGQPLKVTEIKDFAPTIRKGTVIYAFTVPLPAPVDPLRSQVSASVADESYFVEVSLDEHDPVRFEGLDKGGCSFEVTTGKRDPVYGSVTTPAVMGLRCGG